MILTHGANSISRGGGGNTVNIGGRDYRYVEIGTQVWLAENLDFAPSGISVGITTNTTSPNAGYYNNDANTYGENGRKCGLLYNWYAVKYLEDNKASFFNGWHVPTYSEIFNTLQQYVGAYDAGKKLKAAGLDWATGWNGTDDYGFAMLPGGGAFPGFFSTATKGYLWAITDSGSNADAIYFDSGNLMGQFLSRPKTNYLSLRLVKDA